MDEVKTDNKFSMDTKKIGNQIKTFFGVPANTILVAFGLLLLVLNIVPLISVITDTVLVHDYEYVPNAVPGSLTWYHYYEVFGSSTSNACFT